jgi:hypothetical protein
MADPQAQATAIGQAFVQHYYQIFDADRTKLVTLYVNKQTKTRKYTTKIHQQST